MRKTVLVCDSCGKEVAGNDGAQLRVNFDDARRQSKQGDLCVDCASALPGQSVARRGRKPRTEAERQPATA